MEQKRYFFFSYSWLVSQTQKMGYGNTSFSSNGFLSNKELNDFIKSSVSNDMKVPKEGLSIVVLNWKEFTKEDYEAYISNP